MNETSLYIMQPLASFKCIGSSIDSIILKNWASVSCRKDDDVVIVILRFKICCLMRAWPYSSSWILFNTCSIFSIFVVNKKTYVVLFVYINPLEFSIELIYIKVIIRRKQQDMHVLWGFYVHVALRFLV